MVSITFVGEIGALRAAFHINSQISANQASFDGNRCRGIEFQVQPVSAPRFSSEMTPPER
jgi:hypothetical protein